MHTNVKEAAKIMLTKEKIEEILSKRIEELSSSELPHFLLLSDIKKAAERIVKAVRLKEKITVVGDYDVDGVCSSAVMKLFFEKIGCDIDIVIPDRFEEGYGLSVKLLSKIDADLIITVDNGITSFEAVDLCNETGVDVIITDHHTPVTNENSFKLPDAYAVINPKTSEDFPFKEICGAEVAWYLCAAIKNELDAKIDLREFTDILSLAIVADVMPLTHMNRTIVNMGLKRLNKGLKPFSRALKKFFNRNFGSEDIAFQIAPRLNAAGRMAHAITAFEFLTSNNDYEAFELLMQLDKLNTLRKETEKETVESIGEVSDNFIVVKGDFHEGVVGIVASRLVHKYKKPAIVLSRKGDVLKGSGRSLGNIDIFELINECRDLLEGYGGHKMACGLSINIDNFEPFRQKINEKISKYKKEDFFIKDHVLGELPFCEIDIDLIEILKRFEPYGEGNPKPKFFTSAEILNVHNIKDNHFKLILKQDDIILPGLIFKYDGTFHKTIAFKFSVNENDYYKDKVELLIEEIL